MALRHRPADERITGPQIENVKFIDPRRDNQQRPALHGLRHRLILDELHQVVLINHLPRRDRDVLADAERLHVGHLDREASLAALEVLEQILQPVEQVLALALDRRPQGFGIGHQEIGRGERVDKLARIEIHLAGSALVDSFDIANRALHPPRRQKIALLDEVEERVFGPRRVAEPPVARRRLDHRLGVAAEKPLGRALPQGEIVVPQRQLRLDEPRGVGHHAGRHLQERGSDPERIGHSDPVLAALPGQELGDELLAFPGDFGDLL